MQASAGSDAHSLLGVPPGSPKDVIKRAYRKLVLRTHPDIAQDGGSEDRFIQVPRSSTRCPSEALLLGPLYPSLVSSMTITSGPCSAAVVQVRVMFASRQRGVHAADCPALRVMLHADSGGL